MQSGFLRGFVYSMLHLQSILRDERVIATFINIANVWFLIHMMKGKWELVPA